MNIDDRLIKGLHSDNEKDRSVAWDKVATFIGKGIITKEDSAEFIELLRYDNEDVRSYAWYKVDMLIDKGIITKEDTEK